MKVLLLRTFLSDFRTETCSHYCQIDLFYQIEYIYCFIWYIKNKVLLVTKEIYNFCTVLTNTFKTWKLLNYFTQTVNFIFSWTSLPVHFFQYVQRHLYHSGSDGERKLGWCDGRYWYSDQEDDDRPGHQPQPVSLSTPVFKNRKLQLTFAGGPLGVVFFCGGNLTCIFMWHVNPTKPPFSLRIYTACSGPSLSGLKQKSPAS